jgi:hypothetical protein
LEYELPKLELLAKPEFQLETLLGVDTFDLIWAIALAFIILPE